MIPLIDGDVVAHMAAFAAQRNVYFVDCVLEGTSTGTSTPFSTRQEAEQHIEDCRKIHIAVDNFVGFKIRKEVIAESAKHAEMCARQIIMKILSDTKATNYKLFLTSEDKSNFRLKIAKTKPYKGNRLKSSCCNSVVREKLGGYVCKKCSSVCGIADTKPVHYNHVRNYLHLVWEGYVVFGEEADDYLGIEQCKDFFSRAYSWYLDGMNPDECFETIICSIDKDLKMIPGWHYNIKTGEKVFANEDDAMCFFWKQMLMGDTIDNIQGVPRIGEIKAEKLISNCETLEACREIVQAEYEKYYKGEWKEKYLEMGNLLWIKREPNIIFEDLNL